MSVKHDTQNGWITVKIRKGLYNSIQKFIKNKSAYGVPEYDSAPDFITKACLSVLDKEKGVSS